MKLKIIRMIILSILFLLNNINSQNIIDMTDDFENGLNNWEFFNKKTMEPISDENFWVNSEDDEHGMVLSLPPGQLITLIKGSEKWSNYKIEGDVYFPKTEASLMGLIYNLNIIPRPKTNDELTRVEFGSVYIKCGGSYIRVNPHYDGTAGRALYDEYKTPLTGEAAVSVGEWKHFKYEIVGGACHLYVDDMEKPKVTFNGYHFISGRVGFRPRSAGSECWIDNIEINSINGLTFKSQVNSNINERNKSKLITDWMAIGPFKNRVKEIEEASTFQNRIYTVTDYKYKFDDFHTDNRGCVISGRICDFNPPDRKLAYFSTQINSDTNKAATFRFSSRSDLMIFVNGKLVGNIEKVDHIWSDFWCEDRHKPTDIEVQLKAQVNFITILVNGGKYPGCGFFLYVQDDRKVNNQ